MSPSPINKNDRGQIVERLKKLMPAIVEERLQKLGILHQRGLLNLACVTIGELTFRCVSLT